MIAIKLDMWLKEYMENKIIDGKMKIAKYPMILNNLSYWFGGNKCHREALQMANEGVDFCIKYGNLATFPNQILNKGVALAELGDFDTAKIYLHQAITILQAMKKEDTAQFVIAWCRNHYLVEF